MLPLFEEFPDLQKNLPHQPLCDLPTPVRKAGELAKYLELEELYFKEDNLTGKEYGGNKIRKLEFLLGAALAQKKKDVIAFGFAGSNFCLATAIYARKLGLNSTSLLLPQPPTDHLRKNLLFAYKQNARLRHNATPGALRLDTVWNYIRGFLRTGRLPLVIPPGGSSPRGICGFVNAAFELKKQVAAKELPEPDLVYVPMGSMGSAAGLTVGLKAAGMKTRVVAVRVIGEDLANAKALLKLCRKTARFMGGRSPGFPYVKINAKDLEVRDEFFGAGYGEPTPEANEAIKTGKKREKAILEGTYSGKCMAALFADARAGRLTDKVVLFWNTHNSRNFSKEVKDLDYHELPKNLQVYFKQEE